MSNKDAQTFMEKLFHINCAHNHKVESNGKCYSKECVLNQDSATKQLIELRGCEAYKNSNIQELVKIQSND